ncbi:MAG: HAD-IC family P-type ATPase [Chloroflexi bacterium]|nr:HAD-IC family P-type ATPase [Chloroflexota bacterium]
MGQNGLPAGFVATHQGGGLTSAAVLERREQHGRNELPTTKGVSPWMILLAQFKSPLVYIILAAALISLIMGEMTDFAIIMAVVVIDAVLGFVQEYQAQRTYTALKSLLKPTAIAIRDGQRQEVEVWELVPGDLVVLGAGERIPADGVLLESAKLAVDEAILTGESEPVTKSDDAAAKQPVYMGTTVVTGRGVMAVTETGIHAELGKIATSLHEAEEQETPLQTRLKQFSKSLTKLVIAVTLGIYIVGVITGRDMVEMLRVSIILAIAAVPEGLLIAVTVVLVLGMRKILKRNGLVKKLLAVETLGSVTVICTDKTGTLTEGRMRVTHHDFADQDRAVQTMILCNNLDGPVDVALWEFARQELGDDPERLLEQAERLGEEPFTSEAKFMVTSNRIDGQSLDYLKGAPEVVLGMCQASDEQRQRVLGLVDQWAGEGLRPLGLAVREAASLETRSGYTWVGLVAMEDPIREGVRESIDIAHRAGVAVKMVTGDYRRTAVRIAAMAGLKVDDSQVMEGAELAALDDEALKQRVERTAVFSRIRPQDKLRIVKALQANGEMVAMIGDGVNDAPALKRSNIGVVVGSATDVAKETADLILLDNNFRTVVAAIEEGRVIFENIRKVVAYTLSNSFAEVLTIFAAMVLGWPAPLAVAQILWIHLICDGPSDIVLGFEPKEAGIMDEKPKRRDEPILNRLSLSLIGIISGASAVVALALFGHYWLTHQDLRSAQSLAFGVFAVNSMIYIFPYRSLRRSLLHINKLSANKPLIWAVVAGLALAFGAFQVAPIRNMLGIEHLHLAQWALIGGVALGMLLVVELAKFVSNRWRGRPAVEAGGVRSAP